MPKNILEKSISDLLEDWSLEELFEKYDLDPTEVLLFLHESGWVDWLDFQEDEDNE